MINTASVGTYRPNLTAMPIQTRLLSLTGKWWFVCAASSSLCIAVAACNTQPPSGDTIEILRIGVMPDQNHSVLAERHQLLTQYLESEMGLECQLVIPDSYADLQRAFENDEVDLAWFGGYTFVRASQSHGAVPLVSRDRDLRFTSCFLVRTDSPAGDIHDLRGKRIAFGSLQSTSGHLMPRHFLET